MLTVLLKIQAEKIIFMSISTFVLLEGPKLIDEIKTN